MKNERRNKKGERFMKVKISFVKVRTATLSFAARKYAQLKKTRHHRAGKQHSVDDDEEDIGMQKEKTRRSTFSIVNDLDNAFSRGRGADIERPDRPRTFMRRWHIQQRVIK